MWAHDHLLQVNFKYKICNITYSIKIAEIIQIQKLSYEQKQNKSSFQLRN